MTMHSTSHFQKNPNQQSRSVELHEDCEAPPTLESSMSVAQPEALGRLVRPRDVLRQILSTYKEDTPSSEIAISKEDHLHALPSPYLRGIGWGSCGKIYHQLGTNHVIKKAINGNIVLSDECRLWNDLIMHKKVEEVIDSHNVSRDTIPVLVPRVYRYISKADEWWKTHDHMFPPEDRTPENLLISEHIPPIHAIGRNALMDYFCPEKLRPGAKLQDSNKDCLIRLYLGKRRDHITRLRPGAKTYFGIRICDGRDPRAPPLGSKNRRCRYRVRPRWGPMSHSQAAPQIRTVAALSSRHLHGYNGIGHRRSSNAYVATGLQPMPNNSNE